MKNFNFKIVCFVLGGLLAMMVTLLFYLLFIVVMAHIMSYFGFSYDSIFSLLFFFIGIEFCSFPFELCANTFTKTQEKSGNMSKKISFLMLSAICVLINVTFLSVFSVLLSGITASSLAVMVASLCLLPFSLMRAKMD